MSDTSCDAADGVGTRLDDMDLLCETLEPHLRVLRYDLRGHANRIKRRVRIRWKISPTTSASPPHISRHSRHSSQRNGEERVEPAAIAYDDFFFELRDSKIAL